MKWNGYEKGSLPSVTGRRVLEYYEVFPRQLAGGGGNVSGWQGIKEGVHWILT